MIAALYVQTNGVYYGLPDVDPWDKERDARLYAGPHPVVAHPPCERWGSFWPGSPVQVSRGIRFKKGDDGGCFAAALAAVREFGGVIEHPRGTHAWSHFGIIKPAAGGGVGPWYRRLLDLRGLPGPLRPQGPKTDLALLRRGRCAARSEMGKAGR